MFILRVVLVSVAIQLLGRTRLVEALIRGVKMVLGCALWTWVMILLTGGGVQVGWGLPLVGCVTMMAALCVKLFVLKTRA